MTPETAKTKEPGETPMSAAEFDRIMERALRVKPEATKAPKESEKLRNDHVSRSSV